ncbi:Hematopoietic prostaglandin D synthase [Trichoplax sp. H2]|nr:Hematopoietic prostaglandin D synthase [Trichoplax sp. H2]|eukprot:RDD47697.1 Hematopoietic prostaglandin D synthase [Trichoplax sp. H2]
MPNIKLYYFDGEGRAEVIRLILAESDIKYKDERIQVEDWPTLRKSGKIPFEVLPVLEVDGHTICQSATIARYIARMGGLAGKTSLEQAKADQIAEYLLSDLLNQYIQYMLEDEELKKAEKWHECFEEAIPFHLEKFENMLIENGGEYFTGKLTYADIAFYRFANVVKDFFNFEEAAKKFPKLTALYQRIANLPNIRKWEESKPKNHVPF